MFSRSAVDITCVSTRFSRVLTFNREPELRRPFTLLLPRCSTLIPRSSSRGSTVTAGARRFITQMPKKQKTVKGQQDGGGGAAEPEASGPVVRDRSGAVTIAVHAKPGAKHSDVTAPPTDGEANTELIRFLAQVLDLKKSRVSLDKGSRSRDKLVRLDSSLSPEEVLTRLRQAAG